MADDNEKARTESEKPAERSISVDGDAVTNPMGDAEVGRDTVPGVDGTVVTGGSPASAGTAPSSVTGGTYAPGTLGNYNLDRDKLDQGKPKPEN